MSTRAVAPVVGIVVIVAGAILLGVTLAAVLTSTELTNPPPRLEMAGSIDTSTYVLTLEHLGGDDIDLHSVEFSVEIDDEPLEKQPPIPFFAASGFAGGPTGPFNSATDDTWSAGERSTFRIASTNDPLPSQNSTVRVTVRQDGAVISSTTLAHA